MAKVLNISAKDVARLCLHAETQSLLSSLGDDELHDLISHATPIRRTLFTRTSVVELNQRKIEIKQINLAQVELTRENFTGTCNIFNLPLYLHYGNHSPGFGAWRELAATTTATNWALSGLCPNFQMMYYWRVLPKSGDTQHDPDLVANSIKAMGFWGKSAGVISRYEENIGSAAEVVVFSEYIPLTLEKWLNEQIPTYDHPHQSAFESIDNQLSQIVDFCRSHGMIHFNFNLINVLTDGDRLFLSNFNLAMSKEFDLYAPEINFYNRHEGYDGVYVKSCLIKLIITKFLGKQIFNEEHYEDILNKSLNNEELALPDNVAQLVKKYAHHALTMHEFTQRFRSSREARIHIV